MRTRSWSKQSAYRDLQALLRGKVLIDRSLKRFTTYRVGGPADIFCEPESREDLANLMRFIAEKGVPCFVIGKGANLLICDRGIRGVVINLQRGFGTCSVSGQSVTVGAGAILRDFLIEMQKEGLGGLERLFGIPGTVGGAIYMNAGAFGSEIADCIVSIDVMDNAGNVETIRKAQIPFGYRVGYRQEGMITLGAVLDMYSEDHNKMQSLMDEIWARRKSKQPLSYPSAGSVFKRPPGRYAGVLIEQAGLKGMRCGGAVVSTKHANFILNKGSASATDIYTLITKIREICLQKFGVLLELENQLVGWNDEEKIA